MAQQLVNIGSQPSDGAGDPIRVSFDKINQNFNEIYADINAIAATANISLGNVSAPPAQATVNSVNGKTGNVILTVNDIMGSITPGFVDGKIQLAVDAEHNALLDGVSSNLNTLKKLATAINNDPVFSATILSQLASKLSLATGGTLAGPLLLHADPTSNLQAATKQYVDLQAASHAVDFNVELATKANVSAFNTAVTTINSELATKANLTFVTNSFSTVNTTLTHIAANVTALQNEDVLQATTAYVDTVLSQKANTSFVTSSLAPITANITALQTSDATRATTAYVNTELAKKANVTYVDSLITSVNADVLTKANQSFVSNSLASINSQITSINSAITTIQGVDSSQQASIAYVNSALATKANVSDLAAKANQAFVNSQISNINTSKADLSFVTAQLAAINTTIATIQQIDLTQANVSDIAAAVISVNSNIAHKADIASVYSKSDIDAMLLNITNAINDWGTIGPESLGGLATDPVTIIEDYGSII
jgi:hypothetical protein